MFGELILKSKLNTKINKISINYSNILFIKNLNFLICE